MLERQSMCYEWLRMVLILIKVKTFNDQVRRIMLQRIERDKLLFLVTITKYNLDLRLKKMRPTFKERINLQIRHAICASSSAMNDLSTTKKILTRFLFYTAFVRKMLGRLKKFYLKLKLI